MKTICVDTTALLHTRGIRRSVVFTATSSNFFASACNPAHLHLGIALHKKGLTSWHATCKTLQVAMAASAIQGRIKVDMQSALSDKAARGLATSLLVEDHRKVRDLFGEYERAVRENWDTRQSIAEEICMQIELHSQVEEEIFYPAIERLCDEFVADAQRRHYAVDERIAQLKRQNPDNAQYDAAMRELQGLFEPHVREEEELFEMLEERVPEALGLLRAKIVRRKEQLAGSTQDMEGRS